MKAIIEARVRRAFARVAERVALPGLRVEADDDRVIVTGRGVRETLGWIGGLLK